MRKQLCDLCGADITLVRSCSIQGINDADVEGNGAINDAFDACVRCYRAWRRWMRRQAKR